MAECMLEVKGLTKRFGERVAVNAVSFSVPRGQTLGLLGPNGAGKSTTVSMVCGLSRPDAGSVSVGGHDVATDSTAAKQLTGFVPQDLALIDDLSALENLKLFGAMYGLSGAALARRCDAVLDLVQLSDRRKDRPRDYSGGMKRRLNIAAALLHEPQLLILDEPTVGVDPQSRNAIFDSLEALQRQGQTLIYTSHYMEEVERLADHLVIIDHGQVIANDRPADLYQRLPAKALLEFTPAQPLDEALQSALRARPGVTQAAPHDTAWAVSLDAEARAFEVLQWLQQQGVATPHFATARVKLEDVFLTLTGRSLRD